MHRVAILLAVLALVAVSQNIAPTSAKSETPDAMLSSAISENGEESEYWRCLEICIGSTIERYCKLSVTNGNMPVIIMATIIKGLYTRSSSLMQLHKVCNEKKERHIPFQID